MHMCITLAICTAKCCVYVKILCALLSLRQGILPDLNQSMSNKSFKHKLF